MTAQKQQPESSPVASVIQIPGYRIKDILGRGGMATVYLAIQDSIGREVALKVLAPYHGDGTFSDRFLREARIVSRLTHPNIVTVYDAGVHLGHHYMAMEYIPGKNLKQARDCLSRKQKVEVVKQVARALVCAGSKGYVHRDIKPENIMLHEDGRAILMDFGLARGDEASSGLTVSGRAMGTPYYMSPEQTKGTRVDHRSDIYSLGVVLFQALSGHVPYDGPSMVAVGIKHVSEPIPPLPAGLEAFQPIINTCLAKEPAHRYQSAEEFLRALEAVSDAELDYIDAKEAALRKAGVEPDARTLVGQPVAPAHLAPGPVSNGRMYASEPVAPLDITESNEFRDLRKRRRRLLLVPVLIGLVGAGYYYRQDLETVWYAELQPRLVELLQTQPEAARTTDVNVPAITPGIEDEPVPPVQDTAATGAAPREPAEQPAMEAISAELAATIARLRNRADQLLTNLDLQPENAVKLAKLYKSWLKQHPGDTEARQRIRSLRQWFRHTIPQAMANHDFILARQLVDAVREITPHIERNEAFRELEQKLLREEKLEAHLQKARDFSIADALVAPPGANALEEFRAALAVDPDNPEANQAIHDIAETFFKRAGQLQKESLLVEALGAIDKGLRADPAHAGLVSLKKEISETLEKQQRIVEQLIQADKYFKAGHIVQPAGRNAYDVYHDVLKKDPSNPLAKRGLRQIEQHFVNQAMQALEGNRFIQAENILNTAQPYFANSKTLADIRARLNRAN